MKPTPTRAERRTEFIEWIYHEALNRQLLKRYYQIEVEPLTPLDILDQLVDLELAELVTVDPSANEFGAGRLYLLSRARPADEAKAARAARLRRAEASILGELEAKRKRS